jgi:hypothetical protein
MLPYRHLIDTKGIYGRLVFTQSHTSVSLERKEATMPDQHSANSGDAFAAGGGMTVNGEAFDPSRPEHRAALEFLDTGRQTDAGATDDADQGDDDTDVIVTSSGGITATTGQPGRPAHVELPGRGSVNAGRRVIITDDPDGDMTIVRRS